MLRVLSAQMKQMGSKLTVFSTYEDEPGCRFQYANIELQRIDVSFLLKKHNFTGKLLQYMTERWNIVTYSRFSDILRLLLAFEHQKTYVDPDILFLDLDDLSVFESPFVSFAVWNDTGSSLELSNSAFCLPRPVLKALIEKQRWKINTKIEEEERTGKEASYSYTEFGPSLFQQVSEAHWLRYVFR